ncbi:MAG: hypothetical protein HKL81_06395 [Acidimicrobiaceae bacterium]|nr:hypothetical protein [Acidimicrobiaceae bacterium]
MAKHLRWQYGELEQAGVRISVIALFEILVVFLPVSNLFGQKEAVFFLVVNLLVSYFSYRTIIKRKLPHTKAGSSLYELTSMGFESKEAYHEVVARYKANRIGLMIALAMVLLTAAGGFAFDSLAPAGLVTILVPLVIFRYESVKALNPGTLKVKASS